MHLGSLAKVKTAFVPSSGVILTGDAGRKVVLAICSHAIRFQVGPVGRASFSSGLPIT